jgi:hypothetical protein
VPLNGDGLDGILRKPLLHRTVAGVVGPENAKKKNRICFSQQNKLAVCFFDQKKKQPTFCFSKLMLPRHCSHIMLPRHCSQRRPMAYDSAFSTHALTFSTHALTSTRRLPRARIYTYT